MFSFSSPPPTLFLFSPAANTQKLVEDLDDVMNDIGKFEELKAAIESMKRELVQETLKTKVYIFNRKSLWSAGLLIY